MQFGMFTSGYQRNPIEHVFEDAQRFGYDYVELWGGRPHAYPYDLKRNGVDEIKALIDKYEMPVKIYTPEMNAYPFNIMSGTEEMRVDSVEYTKAAMDVAKAIGAEYTLISAGHAGYLATQQEIDERLDKSLLELVEHAEKMNHKIIYEPLTTFESNVTTNANQLKAVLDRIDSPYLVGMVDIVVPYIQGESILAYFDKLQDKMVHMHIIDSDGHSETHVLPGEGVLPLNELMYELKSIGYDKTITIELVTAYLNEPRFYAKRALQNLKRMVD
ncbi:fructoselysine 3-epimerase [Neobacillus sp. YIM B02564]|uniref:Fructoselysine 3-epimerase n=1 Tax=Neobacillus paridis TaxID=2803862 RepID=A0ABS1TSM8_9BACI|nr:fructoselysine 3-epimerase [Neobacillus paridis]MBL4954324.1 fructoselysine 3-epimerase [Neobacillus paridis]